MPISPAVVLDDLSFSWPDGQLVIDHASLTMRGRVGLIGNNGAGKTTVLRLITGDLTATSGRVIVNGSVAVLPQSITLRTESTVAELVGIAETRSALAAIEAGATDPALYDIVGSDWDIEARAQAALANAGLGGCELDRPVGRLSGGEAMLIALIGMSLSGASIAVLDEPTNNLDADARAVLLDILDSWPGTAVIVSHDVELLNTASQIVELRQGQLTGFGGNYDQFRQHREREQVRAQQVLATAQQRLKTEQQRRAAAETRLARSARHGRSDVARSAFIGAAADERRRRAEQTAGAVRARTQARVARAQEQVDQAQGGIRTQNNASMSFPDPEIGATRQLLRLRDADSEFLLAGPARVALGGLNGVGKTRLLETILHPDSQAPVQAQALCESVGYLRQRLDGWETRTSVADELASLTSGGPQNRIPALMASFGLRADHLGRPLASLSGGERFKVGLARLLLAEPARELLVLDEPTNNLDLDGIEQLIAALNRYRGGLLVVSHDRWFLENLGVDTWLELREQDGATRLMRDWR